MHETNDALERGRLYAQLMASCDDVTLAPEVKSTIDKLIEQEKKKMQVNRQDPRVPPPFVWSCEKAPLFNQLLQDKALGKESVALDVDRYQVLPPKTNDVQSWQEAVNNAYAQLEMQRWSLHNLQLLEKYGTSSHLYHLDTLTAMDHFVASKEGQTRTDLVALQRTRRMAEERVSVRLRGSEIQQRQMMKTLSGLRKELQA